MGKLMKHCLVVKRSSLPVRTEDIEKEESCLVDRHPEWHLPIST